MLKLNVDKKYKEKYKDRLDEINKNYKKNLKSPANYYGLSHTRQFKNFKDAIESNKKLIVTVNDALATQVFIDEIYKK